MIEGVSSPPRRIRIGIGTHSAPSQRTEVVRADPMPTFPATDDGPRRGYLRLSSYHAFSPTCNSATLKGTPHPPIPQYPSGFFARYCW